MESVLEDTFPKAKIQRCMVHVSRNIGAKVRVKDRKEVLDDFKTVYNATSKEIAIKHLMIFLDKWVKTYPQVKK